MLGFTLSFVSLSVDLLAIALAETAFPKYQAIGTYLLLSAGIALNLGLFPYLFRGTKNRGWLNYFLGALIPYLFLFASIAFNTWFLSHPEWI